MNIHDSSNLLDITIKQVDVAKYVILQNLNYENDFVLSTCFTVLSTNCAQGDNTTMR